MILKINGSESSGNGFIFQSNDDALLVEAGIRLQYLKQSMNYELSKIAGVIISHGHL